jgi:GNAT superfamily N-acetyltransferase
VTPETTPAWQIRLASPLDRERVLGLVPRLRSFGPVPLRSAHDLDAGEGRTLNRYFDAPGSLEGAGLWVAETRAGSVEGAAYAERVTDYFTQELHAHLGILMISENAQGRGVGRLLLETVEKWARTSGFRFLSLNVFAGNERARSFYEHAAFRLDTLKYVKPLGVAGSQPDEA